MNFKILINAVLVILLLHLLIQNITYKKVISWSGPSERFNGNYLEDSSEHNETLQFLLDTPMYKSSPEQKATSCYDELENYVSKCENEPNQVKAGNFYVEDENSSNFMSNVLNTHKFYDRNTENNNPYDGLDLNQLIEKKYDPSTLEKVKNQQCYPPRNLHDNKPLYPPNVAKPDNWNYKNELPMNGGTVVGNVVGFDTLNDGYSIYNTEQTIVDPHCQEKMNCNREPDDIRFGLGYPNAKERATH